MWWVAGIVIALVAALLVTWLASGWREVGARQRELREAPSTAAAARAGELARELRGELDALIARESGRPYFEYQNLFHDPRASAGWSVAPSPLSRAPDDPLVLGYFQVDARGRATTPTVNDEVPELSEPAHLAEHRAFVAEVARVLAPELRTNKLMAAADNVIRIDSSSYVQNYSANAVYLKQSSTSTSTSTSTRIDIVASALVWRTMTFYGAPALVAVRRVDTPDGALAQGFVIDRSALTARLAARAGSDVAALAPATGRGVEIAAGWELSVAANPHAIARAFADAEGVARGFIARFVALALASLLAAGFVIFVVARAERLAQERSQFAAAAAHELRTPLAGLQLYGDMLAEGLGDPEKARDYARRLGEEAARLGRVVSNVLGFSQLERGTLGVDPQLGSLAGALREVAERAQPALDRAGAALALDVAPDLRARFDPDALARIVGNLLDNAEKYARGADDRTIELAARDAGDRVEIAITDHGPGVTDARALFRPFSRAAGADAPPGLGLGLALSRSLARAMGGDLEHRAGAPGATFVLTLPRA